MSSTKLSFKGTAFSLIFCAVIVAFLNLYMNIVATYGTSNMQIDLSADGDVMAFHQFDFPAKNDHDHGEALSHVKHCMGLCPPAGSLLTQEDYVRALIRERVKLLPSNTFAVLPPRVDGRYSNKSLLSNFNYVRYWREIDSLTKPRILWPEHANFTMLVTVTSSAKIIRSSASVRGMQIVLEGDRNAVWKPRRYSKLDSQKDRLEGGSSEIATFHLSCLMNIRRVPHAIGRKINVVKELKSVSDERLNMTFVQMQNKICFHDECLHCRSDDAVCADSEGNVEGAVVLGLPSTFSQTKRILSPWGRTYDAARLAAWQANVDFCRTVKENEFFGRVPIFADLIDASVLDYFIGNADRRHVEYYQQPHFETMLLVDNGKSFGDPSIDQTSILAPLYQCCRIRKNLYLMLLRFSELNLGDALNDNLKDDPLYPILSASHLYAVNRRLRKVLAVVASCLDQHGTDEVLIDDRF